MALTQHPGSGRKSSLGQSWLLHPGSVTSLPVSDLVSSVHCPTCKAECCPQSSSMTPATPCHWELRLHQSQQFLCLPAQSLGLGCGLGSSASPPVSLEHSSASPQLFPCCHSTLGARLAQASSQPAFTLSPQHFFHHYFTLGECCLSSTGLLLLTTACPSLLQLHLCWTHQG